jgi:hypothetical protein
MTIHFILTRVVADVGGRCIHTPCVHRRRRRAIYCALPLHPLRGAVAVRYGAGRRAPRERVSGCSHADGARPFTTHNAARTQHTGVECTCKRTRSFPRTRGAGAMSMVPLGTFVCCSACWLSRVRPSRTNFREDRVWRCGRWAERKGRLPACTHAHSACTHTRTPHCGRAEHCARSPLARTESALAATLPTRFAD